MTRIAPLILLIPALAGCHLFASGAIDRTCEDLPGGCDGVDTAPPEDTAPFVPDSPYTTRVVVGVRTGGRLLVRVVDPDLGVIAEASTEAPSDAGPVAWDESSGRLFAYDNGSSTLHVLEGDADGTIRGEALDTGIAGIQAVDLEVIDGLLYLLSSTALFLVNVEGRSMETLIPPDRIEDARAIAPAYEDNVWILDRGWSGGLPDLWRGDLATGAATLSAQDFDDGQGRAATAFQGLDAAAWVCSELGAVYAVESLRQGQRSPAALPDPSDMEDLAGVSFVEDVTDCAVDAPTGAFLVASATVGVIAIDAWNNVDPIVVPEPGETLLRAAFVPAPDSAR